VCEFLVFSFSKNKIHFVQKYSEKNGRNSIQLAKKKKKKMKEIPCLQVFVVPATDQIGQRYRQPSSGWRRNYELRRYRQRGKRALTTAAVSRRPALVDSTGCGASICCWPTSSSGSPESRYANEARYANECQVSSFELLRILGPFQ
jgi:hypothetical protein